MKDLINLLKLLINYQFRMKIIHWNVVGHKFDNIHEVADSLYELFSDMIDTCGEIIKVSGLKTPSFNECLLPDDEDFCENTFTASESFSLINTMLSSLLVEYNKVLSNPKLLEGIKSKLGDDQYKITVEIYKNKQRISE